MFCYAPNFHCWVKRNILPDNCLVKSALNDVPVEYSSRCHVEPRSKNMLITSLSFAGAYSWIVRQETLPCREFVLFCSTISSLRVPRSLQPPRSQSIPWDKSISVRLLPVSSSLHHHCLGTLISNRTLRLGLRLWRFAPM